MSSLSGPFFNIHDIFTAFTSLLCLFAVALEFALPKQPITRRYLVIAVLVASAMLALHKLITFGQFVRPWTMENNPDLFYVFSVSQWLEPLFIYLVCRVSLTEQKTLQKSDLIHGVFPAFYLAFLYFAYFSKSTDQQYSLIEQNTLFLQGSFPTVFLLGKALSLGYLFYALALIVKQQKVLQDHCSDSEQTEIVWLFVLVGAFLARIFATTSVYIFNGIFSNQSISDTIVIFSIYLHLASVTTVIYCRLRFISCLSLSSYHQAAAQVLPNSAANRAIPEETITEQGGQEPPVPEQKPAEEVIDIPPDAYRLQLQSYMEKEKPYRKSKLSLRELADLIGVSPRTLSSVINRDFGLNFFEFINKFRIDEAKKLLTEHTTKEMSITEVYLSVGFNSRSVFNKFFLQSTERTPSTYRREQHLQKKKQALEASI